MGDSGGDAGSGDRANLTLTLTPTLTLTLALALALTLTLTLTLTLAPTLALALTLTRHPAQCARCAAKRAAAILSLRRPPPRADLSQPRRRQGARHSSWYGRAHCGARW